MLLLTTTAKRARSLSGWLQRADHVPRHMSVMVIDVSGFGRLDNRAQSVVRVALNAMVRRTFRRAGLRWSLSVEDRGDGMILLVPATKSTVSLLDPVIPLLAAQVRRHNETASPRIRLRVSLHVGVVDRVSIGWVGSDLITACRLVDSPAVRRYLRQRPDADVVVAVSDVVYTGIVAQRYRRLDPTTYEPLHVSMKELNTRAWVHVPGAARPEPAQRA
jgi:class 3 adenylate cyclase